MYAGRPIQVEFLVQMDGNSDFECDRVIDALAAGIPCFHPSQLDQMHSRQNCRSLHAMAEASPPFTPVAAPDKESASMLLRPKNRCPKNAFRVARYGI